MNQGSSSGNLMTLARNVVRLNKLVIKGEAFEVADVLLPGGDGGMLVAAGGLVKLNGPDFISSFC